MLSHLRIAALGVISEASLELGPGLVAITGETGAGKTMVISSLGLLLGGRADAGVVRHGAHRAMVEGRFEVAPEIAAIVDAVGGTLDGDELLVARQVAASGRSRAFVGGAQTTATALAEITGELVTIHGQSEQIRLGTPERQREVLDRACGAAHVETVARYGVVFQQRRALLSEREALIRDAQARAREADVLQFGLEEIAAVAPEPGEDAALLAESTRLQAADDLRVLVGEAVAALSGGESGEESPSANDLVLRAGRALAAAARLDPGAEPIVQRLREASFSLNDAGAEAASYLADLDADPNRLAAVMERRSELAALTRKYGSTIEEVLAWSQETAQRLAALSGSDERIEHLGVEIDALESELTSTAASITAAREQSAARLALQVKAELSDLAMPHARLQFELSRLAELGPFGAEKVTLLFSANPGSELAPLAKVASGGELSRVRLALEVVLAESDPGHCFVFDEVDAGVGGAVGLQIGRRLAALGRRGQVIVVTHLAQVAAFADRHLVVSKTSSGEVTDSSIVQLDQSQRVIELARMMTGLADSKTGLAHARDLLAEAGTAS